MKRLEYDKTGNKPVGVNTGCKSFDKQTNFLSCGNVIAPTMIGWNIRAYTQTECNRFTFEPGHLQNYDLRNFVRNNIPASILKFVREITADSDAWLYMFFHYSGDKKIVHGYVVADKNNNHIKTFVLRDEKVVHFAREYVCNVN